MLRTKFLNKDFKKAVAILVALIIIVSGVFVYLQYYNNNEPEEKKIPNKEIDDRISPLTQQTIHMTIHRIRRKGVIIDQVMNSAKGTQFVNSLPIKDEYAKKAIESLIPGIGWDKKPIFSYIATFDGYEYESRTDIKDWETGYINQNIYRLVEEWNPEGTEYIGEKENIDIDFKFLLKEKKLLKTTSRVVDQFSINYDFRTGRWDGDDSFNDSDGYGHYNGTDFEMWFSVYQTDIDGDGIPYWTEVNILNTNPKMDDSKNDPDKDGIPTAWEWKWGYNPNKWDNHSYLDPDGDGLQNSEEYYMEKWLANPYYPEIYIEVDHCEKTPFRPYTIAMAPGKIIKSINRPSIVKTPLDGWEHIFYEESQQMLMDRFNEHGITVHIDSGEMGGGEELEFFKSNYEDEDHIYGSGSIEMQTGSISQYYNNNFAEDRKGIFRYLLILPSGGEAFNQNFKGNYDTMTVPTNKNFYKGQLMVYRASPRMKAIGVAISVLHELGHTCGFGLMHHSGVDNTTANVKEVYNNYMSVMNYKKYALRLFDYSDGTHGENDCDDWGQINPGYFEKTSDELEGLGFDKHKPPFNL